MSGRKTQNKVENSAPFLKLLLLVILILASISLVTKVKEFYKNSGAFAILVSPRVIKPGEIVHVLVAAEDSWEGAILRIKGPSDFLASTKMRRGGGPPFWWSADFKIPELGAYTISLMKQGKSLVSKQLTVPSPEILRGRAKAVWETEREWTRATDNLYSAWIDALFHDADERSSWKSLDEITQDPQRNILYNHLGLSEDDKSGKNSIEMRPDCADNPYFLRAYFAWKLRLPFGFHECTRGSLRRAPECERWISNISGPGKASKTQGFQRFLRYLMNAIHSGHARTLLEDENSDYYPLPLNRRSLRPGVVFADPYGHTLVIVRWIPQTADNHGELLAIDAQPDGTVGIKRFWRGNFIFATKDVIGAPGFKAFRPIIQENGKLRPLKNDEIARSKDYANFSLQQKNMDADDFYHTIERLINPRLLDPANAFYDLFKAFHEQLLVRFQSVANGEDYRKSHPGTIIPMPNGAAIFQTTGLWEDYATPNRDMRLLIAMDVLLGFPEKVIKSPGDFKLPKGKSPEAIKKELEELLIKCAREMAITYIRSNGTKKPLTLEEILKRREAFEIAYNPNDCIEVRWGAPDGSEELSTCSRRAPLFQQERMNSMRHWFRKRLHPVE